MQAMQLNAGILSRKLPFHRLLIPVPFPLPCRRFTLQLFQRVYPAVQTLAGHRA
jgi:hypothetical protein